MGLLVMGTPLKWDEALQWLAYVREHGVDQFLSIYERLKDTSGDTLKWGDELEYGIFSLNSKKRTAKLSLRSTEILEELTQKESKFGSDDNGKEACHWHPEYGSWMVEATPRVPYGGFASDLRRVEANMRLRRHRLLTVLRVNEVALSMTCFPLMGVGDFTEPPSTPNGPIAQSLYVSDEVINPHPRFKTLTANIRNRRGRNVDIRVPVYKDKYTVEVESNDKHPEGWHSEGSRPPAGEPNVAFKPPTATMPNPRNSQNDPYPGYIHMDCMAFGMGMCCLQVTFQARDLAESRHLYDHLAVLSPLMLALTAATPILKGKLADTDVRWATIAAAVDDRTPQETLEKPPPTEPETQSKYTKMAGKGVKYLPKSRYESISTYICNHKDGTDPRSSLDLYNDLNVPFDEDTYQRLKSNGVDNALALHVAHLFVRDPLVIYSERIKLDDNTETDHFENIQSTNWQTVRWKPPPISTDNGNRVGWRTEFRSMEVQLTDFENAAFTVFIVLVSRVILAFELNLYIPLSKLDANLETAHRRNAAVDEKFYFRSHLAPPMEEDCSKEEGVCNVHSNPNRCEKMTIAEILLGKGSYFPGLIPLVYSYLEHIGCDDEITEMISKYLNLIQKRATGELPTAATWMRRFVMSHPDYQHNSEVSQGIVFDLLDDCRKIGEGLKPCPELLGDIKIEPIKTGAAYEVPLTSSLMEESKRSKIIQRYQGRCSAHDPIE